jgi:hypothetical protein
VDRQTRPSACFLPDRRTVLLGPYLCSFLYRIRWICSNQESIPVKSLTHCTYPSPSAIKPVEKINLGISSTLPNLLRVTQRFLDRLLTSSHNRILDCGDQFPICRSHTNPKTQRRQDFKQHIV